MCGGIAGFCLPLTRATSSWRGWQWDVRATSIMPPPPKPRQIGPSSQTAAAHYTPNHLAKWPLFRHWKGPGPQACEQWRCRVDPSE